VEQDRATQSPVIVRTVSMVLVQSGRCIGSGAIREAVIVEGAWWLLRQVSVPKHCKSDCATGSCRIEDQVTDLQSHVQLLLNKDAGMHIVDANCALLLMLSC
jgi:hypothetical protein